MKTDALLRGFGSSPEGGADELFHTQFMGLDAKEERLAVHQSQERIIQCMETEARRLLDNKRFTQATALFSFLAHIAPDHARVLSWRQYLERSAF